MKITFAAGMRTPEGGNPGDEFSREGIRLIFDQIYGKYDPFYLNRGGVFNTIDEGYDEPYYLTYTDKLFNTDLFVWAGGTAFWRNRTLPNGKLSTSYNVGWGELWDMLRVRKDNGKQSMMLGVGSCQSYPDGGSDFLADKRCVKFAHDMEETNSLITVRDKLASEILTFLDVKHYLLPCPAFFVSKLFREKISTFDNVIAINIVPCGGVHKLKEDVTEKIWEEKIWKILPEIRKKFKIIFIVHASCYKEYVKKFQEEGEHIFFSNNWLDYLLIYSRCSIAITNRVHGAVASASFGKPTFLIGNDTRLLVGNEVGIFSRYAPTVDPDEILDFIEREPTKETSEKLVDLREKKFEEYYKLIISHLPKERE